MFPIPKYLKTINIDIQIDIIKPCLELPNSKEKRKKKKAKNKTKNKNTKIDWLGSVK
jgi:hypothetical protein